jgi:hypothetical protein
MSNRAESMIAIAAAILVLFATMLDPLISAILAVVALTGLSIYHFAKR